eukprot:8991497-Pyramimonas_sp.AAC.3
MTHIDRRRRGPSTHADRRSPSVDTYRPPLSRFPPLDMIIANMFYSRSSEDCIYLQSEKECSLIHL